MKEIDIPLLQFPYFSETGIVIELYKKVVVGSTCQVLKILWLAHDKNHKSICTSDIYY